MIPPPLRTPTEPVELFREHAVGNPVDPVPTIRERSSVTAHSGEAVDFEHAKLETIEQSFFDEDWFNEVFTIIHIDYSQWFSVCETAQNLPHGNFQWVEYVPIRVGQHRTVQHELMGALA